MAIEFFTGFEGCGATADVLSLIDYGPQCTYSATSGFNNGKCLRITPTTTGSCGVICTPALTKVAGWHIRGAKTQIRSTGYSTEPLCIFKGPEISIYNIPTGFIIYKSGTLATVVTTPGSSGLTHVEIKLYSHISAGTVQIKINGNLVADVSGLNTSGAAINQVYICPTNTDVYIDNIFIADDWQGELTSYLLKPTSDVTSDFTPSTGSDNYAMVDDDAEDGDTTYVESSTVGHKDLYGYEDAPTNIDIKAVSIVTVMKEVDPGDRFVRHIANQDATEYDLTSFGLGSVYPQAVSLGLSEILNTCPDTTAWTPTKLNAISFGFEIVS